MNNIFHDIHQPSFFREVRIPDVLNNISSYPVYRGLVLLHSASLSLSLSLPPSPPLPLFPISEYLKLRISNSRIPNKLLGILQLSCVSVVSVRFLLPSGKTKLNKTRERKEHTKEPSYAPCTHVSGLLLPE